MIRTLRDFEHEIINQILISELCFYICKSIPVIPGRGSDFIPFFYNLNFSKGAISIHNLLLSSSHNELSIKNYIKQYKKSFPDKDINIFETKLGSIADSFKVFFPVQLRHKIFAHTDSSFRHTDFTNGYTLPESLDNHLLVVQELKETFFTFCNWSLDNSHNRILEQAKLAVKCILENTNSTYEL